MVGVDPWHMTETVTTEREGHHGKITLARPEAMNTFTTQLARELDEALGTLEADKSIRVVSIRGAGKAFSAGIELREYDDYETKEAYEQWVSTMERPFVTIAEMGTPVIASVHGHAVANGLGLLAACDLAVLAEGTKLGATAPKVGLFCMGPAVPLMDSVTQKRCLELLLTGDLIDAQTAYEWGLANRLVPEAQLATETASLAERIAENSPTAVQLGKQAYYETEPLPYGEAIERSNERFGALCTTADAAEGIDAFLSGREPNWTHRD